MAADSEVKLNFTARIEQARAAIKELSSAMQELMGSKGGMSQDQVDLLNELQAQLVAYSARVNELEAAYKKLAASSSGFSEEAKEKIEELEKTVDQLLKKIVDLQVANNELKGATAGVGKEVEKTGQDGVRVVRSMRGVVANFIRDLMRGKLAVRELGVAIKGLMYSTVILGAIQLAMEGIGLVWEKVKGFFGQSEEEMQAAQAAAKRAQDELDKAKTEAANAAEEVRKLKEKLAEKEEAEALKTTLEGITAEYVAQRDAVNATLTAVKEQAQVKARERAAEAAAKTGEMDMELLGLEERFVSGDIGKRDYIVQKADIEKRKREETRVAAVDAAEIERDAAAARAAAVKAELKDAKERVGAAQEEAGKYATDDDVKLAETEHEQLRTRMEEKFRELEKLEAEFEEKYNGRLGIWGPTRDQMEHELRTGRILHKETRQYKADKESIADARNVANIASDRELAKAGEVEELKKSAAKGKEASARLNEERKTAEKLERDADAAVKAEEKANEELRFTLQRTAREGGQDDRMTEKRVGIELGKIDRLEREKQQKESERTEGRSLRGRVSELLQDAREAARTKNNKDDDAAALKAISDFIKEQGDEVEKYGVNVRSLIDVCRKLSNGNDKVKTRVDSLAREIKELQRQVDRRTANP